MYTDLDICLAVLGSLWIGACFGVIVGGINRSAKRTDVLVKARFPVGHAEFEHECDAHYPRVGD
jgi:hypothetical protein